MANEFIIGVKIGAALAGNFNAIFASARTTAMKLGQTATDIGNRHARMGDVMARTLRHPTRNVGELRRQYERLGQTLDQLKNKQEKLTASMARGAALKNVRSELRGQAMETVGTAVALGAPVVKSVMVAASFQDQLRDTAITGEFNKDEEAKIGGTIRKAATDWNQTQLEIGRGLGVLVAGGIQDAQALQGYAPVMAKAATATRASMDDLGSVAIALNDSLKIGKDGFEGALNMLAYAGKRGQFEIKDMAKHLPTLAPMFGNLGITGKEAVAEIGAAFQIARKGAGSNDEAANNFKNFMQKLTAPDTIKDFERANIDLKQSMMDLRAQGLTPMQSMLGVITDYMKTKGPDAAGQFQKAMEIKDGKERQVSLEKLAGAYKLGELFQDMQAMSFIRPAVANGAEMEDIKKGSMEASDKGLLDADFKKRMDIANEQFKSLKISMLELGITVGNTLLPSLTEFMTALKPGIKAFGDWAKQHPGVIKGVVGLVGGLLAGKLAFIGLKYGINLVLSPFNAFGTTMAAVSGRWTLLRAAWQAGRFAPAISGLRMLGGGLLSVGRVLIPFGKGILMTFGTPLMLAGRGVLFLTKLLGGSLLSGLRLAGQAVLWLGRALLMNPIGLIITGIAVGAYLIYRHWDKLKPWFSALWSGIKTVIGTAWTGIKTIFFNFTPLGLIIKNWEPLMAWFRNLPKSFSGFGANLISGLIGGIQSKLGAARDSIVNFGSDIKNWFASTLGIKSPSRVFMGFGDNIALGAAIGIGRSAGIASKAAGSMASQTAAAALQRINGSRAAGTGGGMAAGGAGMKIAFSPVIHVQGGSPEAVKGQVGEALKLSLHELEQLIKRVMQQQERRSY